MSDTDERLAGSLILKDLALFNKATVLFDNEIQPAFFTAISALVKDWLRKGDWKGNADFGSGYFWVCPSKWEEENVEPSARFAFTRRPDIESRSYNLADMCGAGQAGWGLEFTVNKRGRFGGTAGKTAFAKGMAGLADEEVKRGWTNLSKGVFFKPIKLRAELLADAWESGDFNELLTPLQQSLDALVADQAAFDTIIMTALSQNQVGSSLP